VRLIQPIADGVSQSPLKFKWEAVIQTESYTLELFDEALRPVWKAEGIRTNEFTLPEGVTSKLASKSVFFWMITAHLPEGEERPSRLEKFILGK
jgi:hypothetical protein